MMVEIRNFTAMHTVSAYVASINTKYKFVARNNDTKPEALSPTVTYCHPPTVKLWNSLLNLSTDETGRFMALYKNG
jgi:hypothetical protein